MFLIKEIIKIEKRVLEKKRRIFASTVLVGNLLFGNLKTNDLNYSNATPLTQEKVISNQEFNNLDGFHNSSKIIRTGNGTTLEFQQKVFETNLTGMDEVIFVKGDGILPGADGFPLNNNPCRRHPFGQPRMRGRGINVDPPQNIQGLGNIPEAPKSDLSGKLILV
uniref:hypothetical protein n=1 Tax=Nitzschia dubiiformis TaxID=515482 RepID=UPI002113D9EC|nr:hypothetical protein NRL27_pgp028 [Nitzschia dubiiformis]UTQ75652.1 hypothetical protein [Nitzschia dubiiformis]